MFKIREKVVCVIEDNINCKTGAIECGPKKGDILTINFIGNDVFRNVPCLGFEEYGDIDCWDQYQFRKLDYEFAENILDEITEAMQRQEILN